MPQMHIKIDADLLAAAKQEADRQGRTLSNYVRQLLREDLIRPTQADYDAIGRRIQEITRGAVRVSKQEPQ